MSGKFLTPLCLEKKQVPDAEGNRYVTTAELKYVTMVFDKPTLITVPAGFSTDLASTPDVFYFVNRDIDQAAVLHDYLYTIARFARSTCDAIFREAVTLSVSSPEAYVLHLAVRWFGGNHYGTK